MSQHPYNAADVRLLALKLGSPLTHKDERERLGREAGAILYAVADQMDAAAEAVIGSGPQTKPSVVKFPT